ncbi:hypothetical protein MNBD_PLANCTO02-2799 [hydrothermal vent metagenome]|uniref:Uncharacterized protein n=1 Tax=hydrothermal vent metagenome TaxID=652676 RepID=A0A3B1DAD9_9ZZZZ
MPVCQVLLGKLNLVASQNHQGNSDTKILHVLHAISLIKNQKLIGHIII